MMMMIYSKFNLKVYNDDSAQMLNYYKLSEFWFRSGVRNDS